MRDVVELVAAQVRQRRPPARDLEAGGAQEQRVQARDRVVPGRAVGAQVAQPLVGLLVAASASSTSVELAGRSVPRTWTIGSASATCIRRVCPCDTASDAKRAEEGDQRGQSQRDRGEATNRSADAARADASAAPRPTSSTALGDESEPVDRFPVGMQQR